MYFDSHVHSEMSPDSEMNAIEAIAVLEKKGLGVIFTEHVDYLPNPEVLRTGVDFICDFKRYPAEYKHLRSDSVLLGLEIGLDPENLENNIKTANGDYDYIIGSIHAVDGRDVFFEFPEDDSDPNGFISRYLTYAREMVELGCFFDSFGHIEYVSRYNSIAHTIFKYENFAQEFDGLLKSIAEQDLAIEINTSKFNPEVFLPIYKRFAQLGGRFCTLGSDAHIPENLGKHIHEASKFAQELGLQVVYFKERKRLLCN